MKQHLHKPFVLFLFLTLFLSCRNEYLVNDDFKSIQQTKARQIIFKEVEMIPNLLDKISEIQKPKRLIVDKIYTDSLNEFYVNTEYGLLLENQDNSKTYTFKIERNYPTSLFENLVL